MNQSKPTLIYFGNYDLLLKNAAGNRVYFNTLILKRDFRIINVFFTKSTMYPLNIISTCNDGFEILPLKYPKNWFHWLLISERYLVLKTKILNDLNIKPKSFIFYHSLFPSVFTFFFILRLKFFKIKVFFDIVEFDYSLINNWLLRFLKNIDYFLSDKILPNFADGLIVISRKLKAFFKYKKSIIIPPLNNHNKFPYSKNINDYPLKFVFSGTVGDSHSKEFLKKDRIDYIVELFRGNDKATLDIFGISNIEYLTFFPKSSIPSNVKFHGFMPHNEVLNGYSKFDYSIIYRENSMKNNYGFPTKFSEAFSLGLPVISTNFSDLENYLIPGINGFFIPFEFKEAKIFFDEIVEKGSKTVNLLKKNLENTNFFMISQFQELNTFIKSLL
jgi:glycosyltransferase involved in cell wall biosynthesis